MNPELPYPSRRPVVMAANMVATSQPLATQAGVEALRKGGNAADAALAAAMALTVVEPTSNGIGGDVFAQIWDGKELHGLNSSGHAPVYWTRDFFAGRGGLPTRGWHSVTVPGAVAAWGAVSKRFGKLSLGTLTEPAIRYARDGFPVTPITAAAWARAPADLRAVEGFDAAFMPGGRTPRPGEIFRFPEQAETLAEITRTGGESFYRGVLAEKILAAAKAAGAPWTQGDLLALTPSWVTPLAAAFGDWSLHEIPPNGQGIAALIALRILQHAGIERIAVDAADAVHLQIEAIKLAYADAQRYVADPNAMTLTPAVLLSDEYLARRARTIDLRRAQVATAGTPQAGGTVYLAAADASGMMVSFIQSNWMGFGSGVIVPGTGISLHNRGSAFTMDEAHVNVVGPRKRPFHTIIPGFLTRGGEPACAFGVMGGAFQAQGHLQMTLRMALWNQNPQAAFDAPRWRFDSGLDVRLEHGFDAKVAADLAARGHRIGFEDYPGFGGAQGILKIEGAYVGASDPRKDGQAAGY